MEGLPRRPHAAGEQCSPSAAQATVCQHQIRALSSTSEDTSESSIESAELQRQIAAASNLEDSPELDSSLIPPGGESGLADDVQLDSNTALIGWDFSTGDPGDHPHVGLARVELADYLRVRGASDAYHRLRGLGIEVPNDLQFLYLEDLLESGFSRIVAERVMRGIHPPGTRRPDNPQLSSLTTGEVRILDRGQRPIPWIIQNRTLAQRCPGPPLAGLGCRQPDAKRGMPDREPEAELNAPDPFAFPDRPLVDPTDSPVARSSHEIPESIPRTLMNTTADDRAVEEYQHMMYMQSLWGDDEWAPDPAASSSSQQDSGLTTPFQIGSLPEADTQAPGQAGSSTEHVEGNLDNPSIDPTDSSVPRSRSNHSCRVVQATDPLAAVQSIGLETANRGQGQTQTASNPVQLPPNSTPRASSRIGVPVSNPLAAVVCEDQVSKHPAVRKVDEAAYTPNVEDLLASLTGPLEVVHNVSPAEVRRNLMKWKPSAQDELNSFQTMKVVRKFFGEDARRILRDPMIEVIPGKAVCTVKPGDPYKRKFRVVSCGNFASSTVEAQLYAGGAGAESLRTLLVHAARRGRRCFGLDIKSAFLLAPIPSTVTKRYAMRPPRLLVELGLCRDDEIWMIDRALYGFRESPKWWSVHRDGVLAKARWTSSRGSVWLEQFTSESNVWAIRHESGACVGHILVYVDDILILSEPDIANSFISWIRERWECTGLKEASTVDPLRFLGVDIYAEEDARGKVIGFSLVQEAYIDELLRSHEAGPSARATAPVPREWIREIPVFQEFSDAELRAAQSITGELLWLSQRTRVDIGFCVGLMASWVSRYPRQVSKIGARVLEFLANTKTHRLTLIPGRADGIRIYTDASFAPYGSHSISGIVLQYDECTVVWKSKRQSLVTLSTAESELCAGCEGVTLSQSLEALICELDGAPGPKNLMVDNTAAVTLAEGGGSVRTRHLRVRAAFLQDMRERGELVVSHCPGDIQLADCLTKALLRTRLGELSKLLGLGPPDTLGRVAKVALGPPRTPASPEPASVADSPPRGTQQVGWNNEGLALWLALVLLLAQIEVSEGAGVEGLGDEPLGLELPLLVTLLTMSILFVWESGKYCVRSCCSRRDDGEAAVRMLRPSDDDDPATRRSRRQSLVRRAIEREVHDEGLRQRTSRVEHETTTPDPVVHSHIHVQVGTTPTLSEPGQRPPRPPSPPAEEIPVSPLGLRENPTIASSAPVGFLGASSSTSMAHPVPPPPPADSPRTRPQFPVEGSKRSQVVLSDASTQTSQEKFFSVQELCELQVTTSSGRGTGALHLFPDCHSLRNVAGTNRRTFCRYCLQAARQGPG